MLLPFILLPQASAVYGIFLHNLSPIIDTHTLSTMGRPTVVALKSNSVFDWADGSERSGGDDLDLPITHKTRYNPNPRIADITDLVEESSDDDIDNSIKVGKNSSNQYGPTRKGPSSCRQVIFTISVFTIGAGLQSKGVLIG